jgi:hypothetical protein
MVSPGQGTVLHQVLCNVGVKRFAPTEFGKSERVGKGYFSDAQQRSYRIASSSGLL